MLREQSLGTTLALGFVSLLILLAVVTAFTIHEVNATEFQRKILVRELLPAESAADAVALSSVRFDSSLQAFLFSHLPGDLLALRQSRTELRSALLELQRISFSDRNHSYFAAQLLRSADDLQAQARVADGYLPRATPEDATIYVHRYVRPTVEATVAAAVRLRAPLNRRAFEIRGEINRRDARLAHSLVWIFGVTGIIGILLAITCVRLVTEPVGRLSLAARALEKGDYSLALHLNESTAGNHRASSQNELTVLARAFFHMAQTLEEREGRLRSQAERLQVTNTQLQALQSLTDVALLDLPANELADQLLQRLIAGVGGRAGAIFLSDPTSGRLEPKSVFGPDQELHPDQSLAWAARLADKVVAEGRLVVCEATRGEPEAELLQSFGIGSYLATPIRMRDEIIGAALVQFEDQRTFSPTAVNLIQVFAERMERALDRSRAVEELETSRRELERQVAQKEQQLLRAERMASIGMLGGGIAHELRNPLGVIKNAVFFLKHHVESIDSKGLRHLEIIEREVGHSVDIIDDLVDFATGIEPATTRLELNSLIQTSLALESVPPTVEIEFTPAPDLSKVIGDESQILQVVEHIVRNAVQAMEGDGRLQISTGEGQETVWARFQDSGPGVCVEDQSRIFEPLMTTRAKGMGLGLAICKKILEAHGGSIRLVSDPREGATFVVELPVTEKLMHSVAEQPGPAS
jgi:signal transduction histidine kinase